MAKKKQKIQHRIKVTFDGDVHSVRAICTSMVGQGYLRAMLDTGLSYGEAAYRMGLARRIYKLPKGVGFARMYHRGDGEIAKQVREEIIPALQGVVMDRLVAGRRHPTAKVAEGR